MAETVGAPARLPAVVAGLDDPAQFATYVSDLLAASTEYSFVGKALDGTIILWNEGARRLYGYGADELIGRENSSILHTPEDVAAGLHEEILETTLREGKWEGTIERVRKDGSRFIARVVTTPMRNAAREPVGFLLISKDVSG